LHNHGDSWAATRSGTSLPRVTGSAGSHRSGASTRPQPSRPTKRQATDIPVRFPLTERIGRCGQVVVVARG
jgi:hypothetical protein